MYKSVFWGNSKWTFTTPREESIIMTIATKKLYVANRLYD